MSSLKCPASLLTSSVSLADVDGLTNGDTETAASYDTRRKAILRVYIREIKQLVVAASVPSQDESNCRTQLLEMSVAASCTILGIESRRKSNNTLDWSFY